MECTATPTERPQRRQEPRGRSGVAAQRVRVGLIVTPTLGVDAVEQLIQDVDEALTARYPCVHWDVAAVRDSLATSPVHLTELVDAVRDRLLAEDWQLAVGVTDLPLRLARRPLLTHTSPTHGVALISLPALGPFQRHRRLVEAAVAGLARLVGDPPDPPSDRRGITLRPRVQRRLTELATELDTGSGVAYVARVLTGNLLLLAGMIRANRPWRLVTRLSRALLGALAAAAYTLVTSDVWRIATSLDAIRLGGLALAVMTAAVLTLITAHGLWERARDPRVREQVTLFNLTTLATVIFGVVTLYLAVFVATLAGALLLVDRDVLTTAIERPAALWDYVRLAWLSSSLATVGGALGASLESDAAVREAAYGYRGT
jgi:hypothetical protein